MLIAAANTIPNHPWRGFIHPSFDGYCDQKKQVFLLSFDGHDDDHGESFFTY